MKTPPRPRTKLSDEQFDKRIAELQAEGGTDLGWWFLSFATETTFLGGLYLEALHPLDAIQRTHTLALNPGGEVLIWGPLPTSGMDANVPTSDRYRLLSRAECERPVVPWEDE